MKRLVLIAVVVLTVVGAAVGYYLGSLRTQLQTVRAVVGSEKAPFFADGKVLDAFARHGLRVEVDARGSREMATTVPLARYDLAFPSSEPVAESVRRVRPAVGSYTPFASPMAVATFTPILDLLARQGMAKRAPEGHWVLDIGGLLDAADRDLRWDKLAGNVAYPARRDILLTTTRPGDSNSAAMYAWLAAWRLWGGAGTAPPEPALLDRIARLFADQGELEHSSEEPFEKYLTQGMNYAPLLLVYEAQYVRAALAGTLPRSATLAYLAPTVRSAHTVLAFTPDGDRVGRLLTEDPDLVRLAAEHGFRTADPAVFAPVLAKVSTGGAALPAQLGNVVGPPDPAALDTLLTALDQRLRA